MGLTLTAEELQRVDRRANVSVTLQGELLNLKAVGFQEPSATVATETALMRMRDEDKENMAYH